MIRVLIVSAAVALSLSAQTAAPLKPAASKGWAIRSTPDGQPDLQGIWTNPTLTPFERPARLGNKATLTAEEAAQIEREAAANRVERPPQPGDVGNYEQLWMDSGTRVVSSRQTSLVVEPADGHVPLTKLALEKHNFQLAHGQDSWENLTVWDRCITRGIPGGMFPAGYNNAYQIVQTPGYVMVLYEMIHEPHIIPIGTKEHPLQHLPPSVKVLNGDPIGHWEGNTLVVDITNYDGHSQIATSAATGRIRGMPETDQLHVVERFTRTSADEIAYSVTITDPPMYTQPWKVSIPLERDNNYKLYEYACHEGNQAVELVLKGGRAAEQKPASK
jgi:hypothetical protein